jgi:hypothetical protein
MLGTNRASRTWDDDRHVLTVFVTGDPDWPLELEVEHPQSCKVYVGCASKSCGRFWCEDEKRHHVHTYYDCPVGHLADYIGTDEALFGLSMTGPWRHCLMEEPPENIGPVWEEVRRRLDACEEDFSIPMKLHWSGGYDYWGEWDDELVVDLAV